MIPSLRSLTVLGTGIALNLVVAQITPVQAASFIYTNDPANSASFSFSFGRGTGSLSMQGVLTEPGVVTTQFSAIRASALSAALNLSYTAVPPVPFANPLQVQFNFDPARDATLTFDNGNLIGLTYNQSQPFSARDGRLCNPNGGCFATDGLITLFLEGDRYREFVSLQVDEFNIFGQLVNTFENSGNLSTGLINFTTVQSVEAVPEPATVLGTGLVVGLGAVAKRYRDRQKK